MAHVNRWIVDHITRRGPYTKAAINRGDRFQLTATEFNELRDEVASLVAEVAELREAVLWCPPTHGCKCLTCMNRAAEPGDLTPDRRTA